MRVGICFSATETVLQERSRHQSSIVKFYWPRPIPIFLLSFGSSLFLLLSAFLLYPSLVHSLLRSSNFVCYYTEATLSPSHTSGLDIWLHSHPHPHPHSHPVFYFTIGLSRHFSDEDNSLPKDVCCVLLKENSLSLCIGFLFPFFYSKMLKSPHTLAFLKGR